MWHIKPLCTFPFFIIPWRMRRLYNCLSHCFWYWSKDQYMKFWTLGKFRLPLPDWRLIYYILFLYFFLKRSHSFLGKCFILCSCKWHYVQIIIKYNFSSIIKKMTREERKNIQAFTMSFRGQMHTLSSASCRWYRPVENMSRAKTCWWFHRMLLAINKVLVLLFEANWYLVMQ